MSFSGKSRHASDDESMSTTTIMTMTTMSTSAADITITTMTMLRTSHHHDTSAAGITIMTAMTAKSMSIITITTAGSATIPNASAITTITMPMRCFTSWGVETPKAFTMDELKADLAALDDGEKYGAVLRAKGIVKERGLLDTLRLRARRENIRTSSASVMGRLCVIGSKLNEHELSELFGV